MRFFVPTANDPKHSEEMYRDMRGRIAALTGDVSEKRIYSLKFDHEGTRGSIAVGGYCRPLADDGPVLAIFEDARGTYYICTPNRGAFEGVPLRVDGTTVVEEFSSMA